jgi:glucose/arabinose dehydrogenase
MQLKRFMPETIISFVVLIGVVSVAVVEAAGRNPVIVYLSRVSPGGGLRHLVAAGLGLTVSYGLIFRGRRGEWLSSQTSTVVKITRAAGLMSILLSYLLASLFVLEPKIRPYLEGQPLNSNTTGIPADHYVEAGFFMETYHRCNFYPIQIAVGPDENLYATGIRPGWPGLAGGMVVKIAQEAATGAIITTHMAALKRPFGLAFHGRDLYVSRASNFTRAAAGILTPVNTGAVTLLRDLDGDGLMDYYHDVLDDLPGVWIPGTDHQNNGITFGPDGYLYTTVGVYGDRSPTVHPFEGTILRSRPDGSEPVVFARGLRNPFDLVFGPDRQLFCTDNDTYGSEGGGDELNHIVEGKHYGFPYADGAHSHPKGTVSPILVSTSTFEGLAWTDSPELPAKYRNRLYAVKYGPGEIMRVTLHRNGESFRAESALFARIPDALDVAIDSKGAFYVSCYNSKKIYRIQYNGEEPGDRR